MMMKKQQHLQKWRKVIRILSTTDQEYADCYCYRRCYYSSTTTMCYMVHFGEVGQCGAGYGGNHYCCCCCCWVVDFLEQYSLLGLIVVVKDNSSVMHHNSSVMHHRAQWATVHLNNWRHWFRSKYFAVHFCGCEVLTIKVMASFRFRRCIFFVVIIALFRHFGASTCLCWAGEAPIVEFKGCKLGTTPISGSKPMSSIAAMWKSKRPV